MWLKLVLILSISRAESFENSKDDDFTVVSTSRPPFQFEQLSDRLIKLETKLEFQTNLNENNRRIEELEFKLKQIQKLLGNVSFALSNPVNQYVNNHRLEVLELQNKQLQTDLQNFKLDLTKLKQYHIEPNENNVSSQSLDLQNKQILKELANLNFVLTNYTTQHIKSNEKCHQSEASELQQIQKKLENIDFVLKNITYQKSINNDYRFPKNCKEVQERGNNVSKIYRIKPELSSESFLVLCNMDVKGGGWTYILNRLDGSQDFFLKWADYKSGFGNLSHEFWIGLEHLYHLIAYGNYELLIELVDWEQKEVHALYNDFKIDGEAEDYLLKSLGSYSGDAGDSFSYHVGSRFTTKDKDHDSFSGNCADRYGGWWHVGCGGVSPTGKYLKGKTDIIGVAWPAFHEYYYSLKEVRMMTRPKNK